ncbi:oligosaccharide flippase family protein [Sphingomonas sp. RS6]
MVVGFGVKGLGAVTSFCFTWLVARGYGPAGVGAFGTALTTAFMAVTIALLGLDFILVRTVAKALSAGRSGIARAAIRRALKIAMTASLLIATALLALHDSISVRLLGEPSIAPHLFVLALVIPGMVYSRLVSNALRGLGQIGSSQLIEGPIGTIMGCIGLAIAIALGWTDNLIVPAICYVAGWSVGDLFGAWRLARATRDWDPPEPFDEAMVGPGFSVLLANASNLFIDWFATVTLAATHGPAQAGIFRIGYQIASSLKLLAATSETILHPVFAASFQRGDLKRIGRILRLTILALTVASAPVALAVLIAPRWIMGLFGSGFVSGAPAMQILVLGQLLALTTAAGGAVLVMVHREKLVLGFSVAGAALSAALALWLIPPYGAVGAAIATALPFLLIRMSSLAAVRWVVGVR